MQEAYVAEISFAAKKQDTAFCLRSQILFASSPEIGKEMDGRGY